MKRPKGFEPGRNRQNQPAANEHVQNRANQEPDIAETGLLGADLTNAARPSDDEVTRALTSLHELDEIDPENLATQALTENETTLLAETIQISESKKRGRKKRDKQSELDYKVDNLEDGFSLKKLMFWGGKKDLESKELEDADFETSKNKKHHPKNDTRSLREIDETGDFSDSSEIDKSGLMRAKHKLRQLRRKKHNIFARTYRRMSFAGRRRLRKFAIIGGAIAALATMVAVICFTPIMAVRKITVEGSEALDKVAVQQSLKAVHGKPIALVNDRDIYGALQKHREIQDYSYEIVPPETLIVRVRERVPVIAVQQDDKRYLTLDSAGVVLAETKTPPTNLPLAAITLGGKESETFAAAAKILREMPAELRAQVAEISAQSKYDISFTMRNKILVRWGQAQENQLKNVILQQLSKLAAQRPIKLIDVSSTQAPVFE
ncbi:MAG: cell division protein FtsQ/DivIB [Microbacteriaceae bacterium]|nr:cell division protein FtsQ/DivIB [Microbacteriaceae bacterium]